MLSHSSHPAFVETMRLEDGKISFFAFHKRRLYSGICQLISAEAAQKAVTDFESSAHAQKFPKTGLWKVRAVINPSKHSTAIQWDYSAIQDDFKHKKVGFYTKGCKPVGFPWNAKTTERNIYKQALEYAHSNGWDDAIVLNENGFVADACNFAVLILKDNVLYTPSAADMRVNSVFIEYLKQNMSFPIIEKSLSPEAIQKADALWLCNAVRGLIRADLYQD